MAILDIYLGSKELKRLLVKRSTEFKIPFIYACEEAGVEYGRFLTGYLNSIEVSKDFINEAQFEKILEIYGVDVRTIFILKKDYDSEAVRLNLKAKYDREKIEKKIRDNGKKKRSSTDN